MKVAGKEDFMQEGACEVTASIGSCSNSKPQISKSLEAGQERKLN